MKREPRWYDIITTNIYFLGLSAINQTLLPLVLPLLVQRFVGAELQGTFFGTLRLWALMLALLAQAFWGLLSDRSTLRWGRRRPFIFLGTVVDLLLVVGIALSSNMEGRTGFWFLFVSYLALQVFSNMAQSAVQAFIPDLVPVEKRGRFSAVKALFEVPIPVILISFTIGRIISGGNIIGGLAIMGGIVFLSMLVAMLVKENRLETTPPPLDWQPFLRLLLMTAAFTVVILSMGRAVKIVGNLLVGIESTAVLVLGMGVAGLLAMGIAVVAGVWLSVRIGIGKERAAQHTSFIWWVINRLAFLVGAFNLSGFVLYFIQARLGFTTTKAAGPASQMMMFVGVALLLATLPSGWLTDKFGRKRVVAISGIVAGAGTLLMLAVPNLLVMYIGGCIIGLATGAFYTANWALGTSLVPENEAGRFLGIANLAGAGAGAVGAYISGPIADYFTVHVPEVSGLGYILIFALYSMLFLLSTVILLKVKEPAAAITPQP